MEMRVALISAFEIRILQICQILPVHPAKSAPGRLQSVLPHVVWGQEWAQQAQSIY